MFPFPRLGYCLLFHFCRLFIYILFDFIKKYIDSIIKGIVENMINLQFKKEKDRGFK